MSYTFKMVKEKIKNHGKVLDVVETVERNNTLINIEDWTIPAHSIVSISI